MHSLIPLKNLIKPQRSGGFSLIEMAIVLMILGILLSGVLVAVGQSTENVRRTNASNQLRLVEEALYAFAQTYGRLPCPATTSSNGLETCTSYYGFVPAATLGLSGNVDAVSRLVLDPWQNPLGYVVMSDFTSAATLKATYAGFATYSVPMFSICSTTSCDADTTVSDIAPAVVISYGPNRATTTSAEELENTNSDEIFVSTTYNQDTFDDQLIWLSPYILFSRMISAGKLP